MIREIRDNTELKRKVEDIISYLCDSNGESVRLYFLIRNKNRKTLDITYSILKSTISPDIGKELVNNGKLQFLSLIEKGAEFIDYGILLSSDRDYIEKIRLGEVPYLKDIIIACGRTENDTISDDLFKKVWGYIIRVETENASLFLLKKSNESKLLKKNGIATRFKQGQFDKLNDQVVILDEDYDAALMIKEALADQEVLIFKRYPFESLLSFVEFYQAEIKSKIGFIKQKALFDDTDGLIEICTKDGKKIRKLAKIIKGPIFNSINQSNISQSITAYKLNVALDSTGKIKVSDSNIWDVFRIMDDDCVNSDISGNKYLAHGKMIV